MMKESVLALFGLLFVMVPLTPPKASAEVVFRLSCHWFRGNEVRLWLSILAYNLGNLWRRLALPKQIEKWSLTSL